MWKKKKTPEAMFVRLSLSGRFVACSRRIVASYIYTARHSKFREVVPPDDRGQKLETSLLANT